MKVMKRNEEEEEGWLRSDFVEWIVRYLYSGIVFLPSVLYALCCILYVCSSIVINLLLYVLLLCIIIIFIYNII